MPGSRAAAEQASESEEPQSPSKRSYDEVESETEQIQTPSKRLKRLDLGVETGALEEINVGSPDAIENGVEVGAFQISNGPTSEQDQTPKTTPKRRGRPPKNKGSGFDARESYEWDCIYAEEACS